MGLGVFASGFGASFGSASENQGCGTTLRGLSVRFGGRSWDTQTETVGGARSVPRFGAEDGQERLIHGQSTGFAAQAAGKKQPSVFTPRFEAIRKTFGPHAGR